MKHLDLTLGDLRIVGRHYENRTTPWRVEIFDIPAGGKSAKREWTDAGLAAVLALAITVDEDYRGMPEGVIDLLDELAEDACAGLDKTLRPIL